MRNRKPAEIVAETENGTELIAAEHTVRSENGHWLTIWTEWADDPSERGRADMQIPRERVVAIKPRDTDDKRSSGTREVKRA